MEWHLMRAIGGGDYAGFQRDEYGFSAIILVRQRDCRPVDAPLALPLVGPLPVDFA